MLNEGVFWTANQLFGIKFIERFDIPVYHPDVRVWEIFDHDGVGLALFYGDFFARDSKSGGAWMGNFVEQSTLNETQPGNLQRLQLSETRCRCSPRCCSGMM